MQVLQPFSIAALLELKVEVGTGKSRKAVDLTQAHWAKTTQLKNPGLFRLFFQGLPPGGNARHKCIATLALQNRLAGGILRVDGDKGLGDLLDQCRVRASGNEHAEAKSSQQVGRGLVRRHI